MNFEDMKVYQLLPEREKGKFVDVYNNYEVSSQDNIKINFNGTEVSLDNLDGIGMRALATVYNSAHDVIRNVPDLDLEDHLFRPRKGDNMYESTTEETRYLLAEQYKLRAFVLENVEKVTSLTFAEIIQSQLPEEIKAWCFTSNKLDVSNHLEEADSYVSTTNNHAKKKIVYKLFKGEVDVAGEKMPVTFVQTYDASTDRMFSLQTYNKITSAKDAAASLIRLPKEMIPHLTSFMRQGEKYLVEYNLPETSPEFAEKMKSERTYLTGEKYWETLEFES